MTSVCELITGGFRSLYSCSEHGKYTRVQTPFLYPDGDVVELFVEARDGGRYLVTDLGESLQWLRLQSFSDRRSPKQRQLIADICLTLGVRLDHGVIVAHANGVQDLPEAVNRVSQAALRVADLWFTFRSRIVESVNDEVSEFLTEQNVSFERPQPIAGRSGRAWKPDFLARTRHQSLIYVLSSGSRPAAKSLAEHVTSAWYDLSNLHVGPESIRFVSLFDDTADVWTETDIQLVQGLSEVAYWTKPETLLEAIAA
jgi:hypothetical protein